MVEGYICDECFGFVIEYLQSFEVVQRCVWDADEERRWCWWGGRRCWDQICDESNLKGPSPPICINQHINYDILDGVSTKLQTFFFELEHDLIFIKCSKVFWNFNFLKYHLITHYYVDFIISVGSGNWNKFSMLTRPLSSSGWKILCMGHQLIQETLKI